MDVFMLILVCFAYAHIRNWCSEWLSVLKSCKNFDDLSPTIGQSRPSH